MTDLSNVAERFWAKVDKRGPTMPHMKTRCWVWTAARTTDGYGQLEIAGKCKRAHRVAFFLKNGYWPEPQGLHRCDNPLCVRWGHIRQGTQRTNMRDKARKGRSNNWNAAKTHCKYNHEFTQANTRNTKDGRICRACDRTRSSAKYALRKLRATA